MARPKGSLSKDTQKLVDKTKEMGVDPFEVVLLFAKNDYEALGYTEHTETRLKDGSIVLEYTISPELRLKAAEAACSYIYPKRKSVEVSGLEGALNVGVGINMGNVKEAMRKDPALKDAKPVVEIEAKEKEESK